ncbi:MAG: hypothetical protein WBO55_10440 [Rhizobiaceae bacterium]
MASNKGSSATLTVSGVTLQDGGGTSWVVAHLRGYEALDSTPSGMTTRYGNGGGTFLDMAADTASGVGSFSSRTVAHDVAGQWATLTVELKGAEVQSASGSETRTETGVGVFSSPTESGAFSGSRASSGVPTGVFGEPMYGQSEAFSGSHSESGTGTGVFSNPTDVLAFSGSDTRTETGVGSFFGLLEDGAFAGCETHTHMGFGAFVHPPPPAVITPPFRTIDEVIAGSRQTSSRVTILNGPLAGTELPVVSGTITIEYNADVTRHGNIVVAGLDEWEPVDATDALDVRAGVEFFIETGVTDDAGVKHWWPQGVFRPSKPSVSESTEGLSISCEIHDRAYAVKLASIRRRWVIGSKALIMKSIASVLHEVAPWLPLEFDFAGDHADGNDILVVEYGDDVWSKAREIMWTMGKWLYVNSEGVCVAVDAVDPYIAEAAQLSPVTARDIGTDTSSIVNVVGAVWTEPEPDDAPEGWVPKGGIEEWVDDSSSTSIYSAVGVRARAYSGDASVLHTPSHAKQAALSDGLRLRDLARAATCTVVPDPRLDVGGVVRLDGYTYRVTSIELDLTGASDTSIDLGTARPDLARMIGTALGSNEERRTIEIVTSVSPLRARAIYADTSEISVRWTDALAGVAVGDRIVVLHKGMGERVGVSLLDPKPLADKFAGDTVGTIGGADLNVGDNVSVKARIGTSGTYATATETSPGEIAMTIPEPDTALDWSYVSQTMPTERGDAGSISLTAINDNRHAINDIIGIVSYINGRLVNLDTNNT